MSIEWFSFEFSELLENYSHSFSSSSFLLQNWNWIKFSKGFPYTFIFFRFFIGSRIRKFNWSALQTSLLWGLFYWAGHQTSFLLLILKALIAKEFADTWDWSFCEIDSFWSEETLKGFDWDLWKSSVFCGHFN